MEKQNQDPDEGEVTLPAVTKRYTIMFEERAVGSMRISRNFDDDLHPNFSYIELVGLFEIEKARLVEQLLTAYKTTYDI